MTILRLIIIALVFLTPTANGQNNPDQQSLDEESNPSPIVMRFADYLPQDSFFFQKIMSRWTKNINKISSNTLEVEYSQQYSEDSDIVAKIETNLFDIARLSPRQTVNLFPVLEVFQIPFISSNSKITTIAMQKFVNQQEENFQHLSFVPLLTFSEPNAVFLLADDINLSSRLKQVSLVASNRPTTVFLQALGAKVSFSSTITADAKGTISALVPDLKPQFKNIFINNSNENLSANPHMIIINKQVLLNLHPVQKKAIMQNSNLFFARWVGAMLDLAHNKMLSDPVIRENSRIIDKFVLTEWKRIGKNISAAWVTSMNKKNWDAQNILTDAQSLIREISLAH